MNSCNYEEWGFKRLFNDGTVGDCTFDIREFDVVIKFYHDHQNTNIFPNGKPKFRVVYKKENSNEKN